MSRAILDELEHLRRSLDQPRRDYHLPLVETGDRLQDVSDGLDAAQSGVGALSRVMEGSRTGFDDMEAAVDRVEERQKTQSEVEIRELRQLLLAKENSIDSLRETLATTKQSAETARKRLQSQLDKATGELSEMKSVLEKEREVRKEAERKLDDVTKRSKRHEAENGNREQELWNALQKAHDEHEQTLADFTNEKTQHATAKTKIKELDKQLERSSEKDAEINRLRRALKEEREHFRKARKWLKAEMQSREEMEHLLCSLKEAVSLGSPVASPVDPEAIEDSEIEDVRRHFQMNQAELRERGSSIRGQLRSTKKKLDKALRHASMY